MRYGICTGLDQLELLDELGFDYLEASVTAVMQLSEEECDGYLEQLKGRRITCEAFNILFPKTMELIGVNADRQELTAYLHRAFGRIRKLSGIDRPVVVFGSGRCRRCPEGYDYRQAYRELTKVCRLTGEIAAEYGVLVVIEPLSRTETNMICTMAEGAILAADADHPNVSLLADYFHVIANHDNIRDLVTIGSFGHIHIAAGHGRLYPLAEEGEQYREFITALKTIGYHGRISIEGKSEDIRSDAAKALALLKKLEEEG